MEALELLRSRNRQDVQLPSGLWGTVELPRLEECMVAGGVPFPLVMKVAARLQRAAQELRGQTPEGPEPAPVSQDELQRMFDYHTQLVRRTLKRLAGTEAELEGLDYFTPEEAIEVEQNLPEEDWQQLVMWGGRDAPLPKANTTSTDLPPSSPPMTDAPTAESNGSGTETPPSESETTSSLSTSAPL